MKYILLFCLGISSLSLLLAQTSHPRNPISMKELQIDVEEGKSREIAFTNKQSGVYYTETNASLRNGWQGWRIFSHKMLDDYLINIDGNPLLKSESSCKVFPHQLVRQYNPGYQETVTLLDSIDAIVVELNNLPEKKITLYPLFSDIQSNQDCETLFENNVLLITRKNHLVRSQKENYPVWIGVTSLSGQETPVLNNESFSKDGKYSPTGLQILARAKKAVLIFTSGDTKEQTITLSQRVMQQYASMINSRLNRMESFLNYSYVRTDNQKFDKALNWAKLSLDALIMNQVKKGIFAGLPWFDNYWGRDSYISLPGATLVTGNFEEAKSILLSFAEWQDTNSSSPNYGRIPNIVTTTSIAYNTADGTPRFVSSLYDYFLYSNDTLFIQEMYPYVKRSIDGTLKFHTDSNYFLTHGDAETWMDAVGPDGAWSPRGNRANDIQALWYRQLSIGFRFAKFVNDTASSERWGNIAITLNNNFMKAFYDSSKGIIYDHLNADNSKDLQHRPNVIFTYSLFPNRQLFAKSFREMTTEMVYPYGIASLAQTDEEFHPYHHFEPQYVQDAAYHNGIVWTWLAGAWIDVACDYGIPDIAFQVTDNMAEQILERGATGTLSELLDAAPRKGESEPRLSGTFSQAWSLAEFIRTFYQSYLGVGINSNVFKTTNPISFLSKKPRILLSPRLPGALHKADFRTFIGSNVIDIYYQNDVNEFQLEIKSSETSPPITVDFLTSNKFSRSSKENIDSLPLYRFLLPPGKQYTTQFGKQRTIVNNAFLEPQELIPVVSKKSLADLKLATPVVNPSLKSLKGPTHTLLTNFEVKKDAAKAEFLFDIDDPEGDDNGVGSYLYPLTSSLQAGSLDITHFTVSSDQENIFFSMKFRNLSNPGWHPEYGFQLTYVAIAIDKDGKENSGKTEIGMNSNYILDKKDAFENIIYVGGGIRVCDEKYKILAEYLPTGGDEKNPLGSTSTKSIEFSLPVNLVGMPDKNWHFTVLVGCQDDHGGAGIGEFRAIDKEAQEWVGGGKSNPKEMNVFDEIVPKK